MNLRGQQRKKLLLMRNSLLVLLFLALASCKPAAKDLLEKAKIEESAQKPKLAKYLYHQVLKENEELSDLGEELADVLFVLICIANQTGIDLELSFKEKLEQTIEFLKKIRGMFGFAYFNKETKELVLARDYYGEKPLYYSIGNDGCLYFSSTIKSLLEYREVNQTISKENFATYLAWGYYPQEITPFSPIIRTPFLLYSSPKKSSAGIN